MTDTQTQVEICRTRWVSRINPKHEHACTGNRLVHPELSHSCDCGATIATMLTARDLATLLPPGRLARAQGQARAAVVLLCLSIVFPLALLFALWFGYRAATTTPVGVRGHRTGSVVAGISGTLIGVLLLAGATTTLGTS